DVKLSWCLIAVFLTGCAHRGAAPSAAHAATDSITIQWSTRSFTDAQPLLKLRTAGDSVDLAFKLKPAKGERTLYFGELQNGDSQCLPLVAVRLSGGGNNQQYKAMRLEPEWSYDQWQ